MRLNANGVYHWRDGTTARAWMADVLLDGWPISHVVEADTDEGWVDVLARPTERMPQPRQRLYGKVTLRLYDKTGTQIDVINP